MNFTKKISDLIFGPEEDEEVDFAAETEAAPMETARSSAAKKSKIVSIAATTQMKVVVVSIERFDEAKEVVDHLRNKKPVVVNLEKVEYPVAQKIMDFLIGACYALDGSLQRVSSNIFIIAPANFDIESDVKDESKNSKSVILPWVNQVK